ncbi:MAG: HesA/MoeB/ThiF family protein [Leptospiraceae bacterium]|nr:HesA/MoeB/ThiF family protein [Leptospiraceae bacterium]MCP5498756.1 HesA/MoeB/ThiF family protein [Leptospiraceae bacterium]
MLSRDEITRYSRNILLGEVGKKGQEKLAASTVAVIGAGGLGSPVLFYLAATGIGTLRIVDYDTVDLTNLQRQILYHTSSQDLPKVEAAREILSKLNPNIQVEIFRTRLEASNAESILTGSDIVIEGSDNFETKFLVNDACFFLKIPLIIGGILQFEGQVIGIKPGETACYRCIFVNPPPPDEIPNCADSGVIGSMAGIIGSIQALEATKAILGFPEAGLFGKILSMEAKEMNFRKIIVKKNLNCPLCGANPSITSIMDSEAGKPAC